MREVCIVSCKIREEQVGSKFKNLFILQFILPLFYSFQLIGCSRDGLSVTEIMKMLPGMSWYQWIAHIKLLINLKVLKQQAGLYRPHNSEVFESLINRFLSKKLQN